MTNYVTFVVGEVLLLILTICSMAAIFPRVRGTPQLVRDFLVPRVVLCVNDRSWASGQVLRDLSVGVM